MKKNILKGTLTFLICTVLFVGGSYAYLTNKDGKKTKQANDTKSDEPYTAATPVNCGILVRMPDKSGILFYLNFLKTGITVIPISDCNDLRNEYCGYSVDYNIYADYSLLSGLIDRIGGIEIDDSGEKGRLTGIDVTEKLSTSNDRILKYNILNSTFNKIKETGLTRSDFVYIIENCDSTELSIKDCFYWGSYLKAMANNVSIIT